MIGQSKCFISYLHVAIFILMNAPELLQSRQNMSKATQNLVCPKATVIVFMLVESKVCGLIIWQCHGYKCL